MLYMSTRKHKGRVYM